MNEVISTMSFYQDQALGDLVNYQVFSALAIVLMLFFFRLSDLQKKQKNTFNY